MIVKEMAKILNAILVFSTGFQCTMLEGHCVRTTKGDGVGGGQSAAKHDRNNLSTTPYLSEAVLISSVPKKVLPQCYWESKWH